jgi:hypothetical protein
MAAVGEDPCVDPPLRLLVDGFPRWQVVGHVSPWGAGAQHPPQPIEDLSEIVLALKRVFAYQRQIRSHKASLFFRNVTWVRLSGHHTEMPTLLG